MDEEGLTERLVVEIPPAERLKGTRFGYLMRKYLLRATPAGQRGAKPMIHDVQRVGTGARALRKLVDLRLVVATEPIRIPLDRRIYGRDWTRARAVRRTELGELVVNTFRQELETGKRIRWEKLPSADSEDPVG